MSERKTAVTYAVRRGHTTGLFATWRETELSVRGFSGAEFRKFPTLREAEAWLVDKAVPGKRTREDDDDTVEQEIATKKLHLTPPISLSAQPSLFDGLVLYELVDVDLLDRLVAQPPDTTSAWLLPRYKELVGEDGRACVTYMKPLFGRAIVAGSLGLHNMPREVRHALARTTFTDWDMTNAHPALLLQICDAHGIVCDALRHYVQERETYLFEVMTAYTVTREQAKAVFLRIMYLGGFPAWAQDCALAPTVQPTASLVKFARELKRIATEVVKHNPEIAAYVRDKNEYHNFDSSVLATFLQELESRLLESLFLFCRERRLIREDVAVLCNDGFMLESAYTTAELAGEFNRRVREKHGFDIEFVVKPMGVVAAESVVGDKRRQLIVYCDGACTNNGNAEKARAAIGVWFGSDRDARNISLRLPDDMRQTNQTAELYAAITTLRAVPCDQSLLIRSDSMYTINSATKWRQRWIAAKWSPTLKLTNEALLRDLSDLVDARSAPLVWEHVRGHTGEEGNEAADRLATSALTKEA